MSGLLLDGKSLSKIIEEDLKSRIELFKLRNGGKIPTLATILVGNDPASAIYVRMKRNACQRVGMDSYNVILPEQIQTDKLLVEINKLNNNPQIHGVLLQHPVPVHIDERICFNRIALQKDVDGVTCLGFGRMSMNEPAYGSATPAGIMTLLGHYHIPIEGKRAVVVGRSPILGKPMAMMLLNANATVTICHSRTKELPEIVHEAEILVGAVGKPEFIKAAWIQKNSIVIDAGYHPGCVGDIELSGIKNTCSAYTPVPGGVGPMTIAMLIKQTVEAAEKSLTKD